MTANRTVKLVCLLLATVLLFIGGAVLSYYGDLWFPLMERIRIHDSLDLTPVGEMQTREWSLDALRKTRGVIYTDVMMLVNSDHPLPEGHEVDLIEYNGAIMHPEIKESYIALRDAVQEATGVRIYVASDFRTDKEQQAIYESSPDGIAAKPGHSEHQTGLSLDVYAPHFGGENFLRSEAGRMVSRVCQDYGFILRYPVGKEDVTGISYEPWHIRYVGAPHAELIMNSGLSYEEYIDFLQPNVWYRTSGDVLIARCSSDALKLPENWKTCEISPDNTGYYLITVTVTN